MAEIIQDEGGKKKGGKKHRPKKYSTHIDMTPMVDLACLLLTFFMLTTAFSKPKVMEIVLPEKKKDKTEKAPEIDDRRALNIILVGNDKVLWYNGLANPRKPPLPTLTMTDFSDDGIRKVLLRRNRDLFAKIDEMNDEVIEGKLDLPKDSIDQRRKNMMKEDEAGPVVLIKAGEGVKYRNVVDIIDEMAITNIARYALVDMNDVEKKMVADFLAAHPTSAASNK
jgi:biopolymer transport protein ExbD